jgi:hypothetical protein
MRLTGTARKYRRYDSLRKTMKDSNVSGNNNCSISTGIKKMSRGKSMRSEGSK